MIEEQAVVTRIGSDGRTWINSLQAGGCGSCQHKIGCGSAAIASLLPKREFAVDSELNLRPGDRVVVAIDDSHLLATSALLYLAPLLVMLTAVGVAGRLLPAALAETWLPAIALAALLACFRLIHHFQAAFLLHFCFKPQIVGRTAPAADNPQQQV